MIVIMAVIAAVVVTFIRAIVAAGILALVFHIMMTVVMTDPALLYHSLENLLFHVNCGGFTTTARNLFIGQPQYLQADNGKFAHLRDICETIDEKRERVPVFPRLKEMTVPLSPFPG